jgi:hypothetical protein
MPPLFTGLRVPPPMFLWKYPLPTPLGAAAGVFSVERMWHLSPAPPVPQVLLMNGLDDPKVILQKGTGHPSALNSLSLRRHAANSWPTSRRGARGRATRRAGLCESLTRGYGFMVFVPLTPCGRGIETRLLEYQVVTALKVSGTFLGS